MSLRQSLANLFVSISPENPGAVEALRRLYAHDVVFQDPMQRAHGVDAFIELNRSLLAKARTLSFTLTANVGSDEEFFFAWSMHFKPRIGPALSVDGTSHIRAAGGLVYYHRDYWDIAALLASGVPGGQSLLTAAMKPFV